METVANNPEDGQTEILFSHAQVERFRENYVCSCLMHFTIKNFNQQTAGRVPQKYKHLL